MALPAALKEEFEFYSSTFARTGINFDAEYTYKSWMSSGGWDDGSNSLLNLTFEVALGYPTTKDPSDRTSNVLWSESTTVHGAPRHLFADGEGGYDTSGFVQNWSNIRPLIQQYLNGDYGIHFHVDGKSLKANISGQYLVGEDRLYDPKQNAMDEVRRDRIVEMIFKLDKKDKDDPYWTAERKVYFDWALDAIAGVTTRRTLVNLRTGEIEEQTWDTGKFFGDPQHEETLGKAVFQLIYMLLRQDGNLDRISQASVVSKTTEMLFAPDDVKAIISTQVNDLFKNLTRTTTWIPEIIWTGPDGGDQTYDEGLQLSFMEIHEWTIGSDGQYIDFETEAIPQWKLKQPTDPQFELKPLLSRVINWPTPTTMVDGEFKGYLGATALTEEEQEELEEAGGEGTYVIVPEDSTEVFIQQFPEGTTDEKGQLTYANLDPIWKKELESFNSFATGGDITQYPFAWLGSDYFKIGEGSNFEFLVGDRGAWFTPSWMKELTIDSLEEVFYWFYAQFMRNVIVDWTTDGKMDSIITDHFQGIFGSKTEPSKEVEDYFWHPILIDKEIQWRIEFFKAISDAAQAITGTEDEDGEMERDRELTPEEIEAARKRANQAWLEGEPPPIEELEDEDIVERRKFFKQCALMMNVHILKKALLFDLQRRGGVPFDGRFWMASCTTDQERLITNLIASKDGAAFFDVPPYVLSYLVPKLRLFKVENNWLNPGLMETELVFDQTTDIDRSRNYTKSAGTPHTPATFLGATFDKGDGCGLKNFSVEFKGTTPAESRNDMVATLNLYFQSFADFVRERLGSNGKTYRYVDLILQPTENVIKNFGLHKVHPNQYDPSFFRIRAEMGYHIPDNLNTAFPNYDTEQLRRAIVRTNKSFYLCCIDHSIDVNNDGTVNVQISYRAYVETALKSLRFDALATPKLIQDRNLALKALYKMLSSKKCTKAQIDEMRAATQASDEVNRLQSLQSIMTRLLERGRVYTVKVNPADANTFRKNGFFKKCDLLDVTGDEIITADSIIDALETTDRGEATSALEWALTHQLPDNPEFDYTDISDTTIQYFFLGDLLHTIMDTMFAKDDQKSLVPGMENTRMILGSFDFDAYSGGALGSVVNVAQMPVSVDFFMKWFTDNVLIKGETRKSFPILAFMRNLTDTLVSSALLETCTNRAMEKTIRFHTGQISAFAEADAEDGSIADPLGALVEPNSPIVDTDYWHREGYLPMAGDAENEMRTGTKANHFYNYLLLNVIGSSLTWTGNGNYEDDIERGRYHIDIGSNRGIVKTVKFNKTDLKYAREARFMQQGIDGLMQLSVVYKVTVTMFGNSLFYPGMEFFLNPYGMGGTALGSPTQGPNHVGGRSLANKLGLGGYHTITSVKTSLTSGKYETVIEGQQYYAGDGQGNPNLSGEASAEDEAIDDYTVLESEQEAEQGAFCKALIVGVYNNSLDSEENQQRLGISPIDETPPSAGVGGSGGAGAPATEEVLPALSAATFTDWKGEIVTWSYDRVLPPKTSYPKTTYYRDDQVIAEIEITESPTTTEGVIEGQTVISQTTLVLTDGEGNSGTYISYEYETEQPDDLDLMMASDLEELDQIEAEAIEANEMNEADLDAEAEAEFAAASAEEERQRKELEQEMAGGDSELPPLTVETIEEEVEVPDDSDIDPEEGTTVPEETTPVETEPEPEPLPEGSITYTVKRIPYSVAEAKQKLRGKSGTGRVELYKNSGEFINEDDFIGYLFYNRTTIGPTLSPDVYKTSSWFNLEEYIINTYRSQKPDINKMDFKAYAQYYFVGDPIEPSSVINFVALTLEALP